MLSPLGVPVGINGGSGRIGGNAMRVMIEHPTLAFNLIAINDVGLAPNAAADNFIKAKSNDSTFGEWPCLMTVGKTPDTLVMHVANKKHPIKILSVREPGKIPWGDLGVRGVAECTGVFRSRKTDTKAGYDSHLDGGAKYVMLSAPAEDKVKTVVYGVHSQSLKGDVLLSGASCTSGSLAFPLAVLAEHRHTWYFSHFDMCTIHAYTAGEQSIQDRPDKPGNRRMFAAGVNTIPTTTGAAKAIPEVDGLSFGLQGIPCSGYALRVPVISGSVTVLNVCLRNKPPLETVLNEMRAAARSKFVGKFAVNENPNKTGSGGLPLVSSHIIRRPESSILDVEFCSNIDDLYRFQLWYGNEWGYVYRMCEGLHEQAA